MPKPPKVFEGGGLAEGEGRFATVETRRATEALEDTSLSVSFEEAESIFGNDFLDPHKVKEVFGALPERVPPIPFTREQLEQAVKLGQQLVFFTDSIVDKKGTIVPATFENLMKKYPHAKDGHKMVVMIHDPHASYRVEEVPREGWRLVTKEVIPETRNEETIPALGRLLDYYFGKVALEDIQLPQKYHDALRQYQERRAEIRPSMHSLNWREYIVQISELAVSDYFCERAVECLYRLMLTNQLYGTRLLSDVYARTGSIIPEQGHVTVGFFNEEGVVEGLSSPLEVYPQVGMCFSRGAAPE